MTRIDLVNSDGDTLRMNDGTADADGTIWVVQNLTGWGGAKPRIQTMKRMASDGVVITNATYAERPLSIAGVALLSSRDQIWEAIRAWEDATDMVVSDGKMIVYGPAGTEHAATRLVSQPQARISDNGALMRFSARFIASVPALQAGA